MKLERINGVIFEAMVKGGYNNLCLHEKRNKRHEYLSRTGRRYGI